MDRRLPWDWANVGNPYSFSSYPKEERIRVTCWKPTVAATLIGLLMGSCSCRPQEKEDFQFRVTSVAPLRDKSVKVFLDVTKFDQSQGRNIMAKLRHTEGEMIGRRMDAVAQDADPYEHFAYDPETRELLRHEETGEGIKARFETGARIVAIELDLKIDIPRRVCTIVFGADGSRVCAGVKIKHRPYIFDRVIILDRCGNMRHWWKKGTGAGSMKLQSDNDRLCLEHAQLHRTPVDLRVPPPSSSQAED